MDSASVYGLGLLVLEGTGGKTLATDHRVITLNQTVSHDQSVRLSTGQSVITQSGARHTFGWPPQTKVIYNKGLFFTR